jgi:hypothetical protein
MSPRLWLLASLTAISCLRTDVEPAPTLARQSLVEEVSLWFRMVDGPPVRSHPALAYDLGRQRTLLFGGWGQLNCLNDTWAWDGIRWADLSPATQPSRRYRHAVAFDTGRSRLVSFGGDNCNEVAPVLFNDTWEFDGVDWIERMPAGLPAPSARANHALAFDSVRGRTVLFGGSSDAGYLADTWEWDGSNWQQRAPANSPPGRARHALTYDSVRQRVVLFGGRSVGATLGDTWEWDGTNWTEQMPATIPEVRLHHALAFDSVRFRTLMFGGDIVAGSQLGDLWEWDGTDWAIIDTSTTPLPRARHSMAFDVARNRLVLFGGLFSPSTFLGETWEFALARTTGSDCVRGSQCLSQGCANDNICCSTASCGQADGGASDGGEGSDGGAPDAGPGTGGGGDGDGDGDGRGDAGRGADGGDAAPPSPLALRVGCGCQGGTASPVLSFFGILVMLWAPTPLAARLRTRQTRRPNSSSSPRGVSSRSG